MTTSALVHENTVLCPKFLSRLLDNRGLGLLQLYKYSIIIRIIFKKLKNIPRHNPI